MYWFDYDIGIFICCVDGFIRNRYVMLVESDEDVNYYFIVGLGCEVVFFFDFLYLNFRMYSGLVFLIGYGNWSGLLLLKLDIILNKNFKMGRII